MALGSPGCRETCNQSSLQQTPCLEATMRDRGAGGLTAPAPTLTASTAVKTHLRLSYRGTEFPIPNPPTKLNIVGSSGSIRVLPVWPSRRTQSLWWSRAVLQSGVGSKPDFQTLN